MESGESLGPPLSAQGLRRALHAEAKGVAARWVAILGGAVGSGTTGRAGRWLRRDRRDGAGETCVPRMSAGDRAAPAGTGSAERSVGERHDPG